jgi:hypothetical protein
LIARNELQPTTRKPEATALLESIGAVIRESSTEVIIGGINVGLLDYYPRERKTPPRTAGFYAPEDKPAHSVGGDYCDFLPLPTDGQRIAIGDVCGKGIGATLLMATTLSPLIPGKPTELKIYMWPTSILMRKVTRFALPWQERTLALSAGTHQWLTSPGRFIDKLGWSLIWSCLCNQVREVGFPPSMRCARMKTSDLLLFGPGDGQL